LARRDILGVHGRRIIIKRDNIEIGWDRVTWIHVSQDRGM
jgi:hypothetical protein